MTDPLAGLAWADEDPDDLSTLDDAAALDAAGPDYDWRQDA